MERLFLLLMPRHVVRIVTRAIKSTSINIMIWPSDTGRKNNVMTLFQCIFNMVLCRVPAPAGWLLVCDIFLQLFLGFWIMHLAGCFNICRCFNRLTFVGYNKEWPTHLSVLENKLSSASRKIFLGLLLCNEVILPKTFEEKLKTQPPQICPGTERV
jgi:hypothetical protein